MKCRYCVFLIAFFLFGCGSENKENDHATDKIIDFNGTWAIQSHMKFYNADTGEFFYTADGIRSLVIKQSGRDLHIFNCEDFGKDYETWQIGETELTVDQYVVPYSLRSDGAYERTLTFTRVVEPNLTSEEHYIMYKVSDSLDVDSGFLYLEGEVSVNEEFNVCVEQGSSLENNTREIVVYAPYEEGFIYLDIYMSGEITESYYNYDHRTISTPFSIDVTSSAGINLEGMTNNLGANSVDVSILNFDAESIWVEFSFMSQFNNAYYGSANAELWRPKYTYQVQGWAK